MRLAATGAPGRQNQKKHMTHTRKKALTYVYVSLYLPAPPPPSVECAHRVAPRAPDLGSRRAAAALAARRKHAPGAPGCARPRCVACARERADLLNASR